MIISVVACGPSAKDWFNTPHDYSVGVNDCFKWGKTVDALILINDPKNFEPKKDNGFTNRLKVIKESKPGLVITNDRMNWKKHFPETTVEEVKTVAFWKRFQNERLHHSRTSPFVAINYAFNIGAKEIIVWGVDFIDHPNFPKEKRETDFEIEQYMKLIDHIQNKGVKVWIGNKNTQLNKYLNFYGQAERKEIA